MALHNHYIYILILCFGLFLVYLNRKSLEKYDIKSESDLYYNTSGEKLNNLGSENKDTLDTDAGITSMITSMVKRVSNNAEKPLKPPKSFFETTNKETSNDNYYYDDIYTEVDNHDDETNFTSAEEILDFNEYNKDCHC